jgi:RND family efflux transporter MFP subunit
MRNLILPLVLFATVIACSENAKDPHTHDHSVDGNEHDYAFTLDTTIWTKKVEMFVEFPAFVKGHTSNFLAHFTHLHNHKPIEKAKVTVSMIKGDRGIRHTVEKSRSPGIFVPALQPKEEGNYQLYIQLETPYLNEKFELGQVKVYPDDQALQKGMAHHTKREADISFTKEQAWKIDFQTLKAQVDTIYGTVTVAGKWMPSPGTQRSLNAANRGNVLYEMPALVEGTKVRKGQILMRISGENLNIGSIETRVKKAKAEFEQAKAAFNRKKELHELKVVPQSEFEEVKKRYELAQANYQELLKNYGTNGVAIRAPIHGFIKALHVENGDFVKTGQRLLTLNSERSNMIKAYISAEQSQIIEHSDKIWVKHADEWQDVKGKVVSIGRNVSEDQPLLPAFIEVESPFNAISGSLTELQIGFGNGEKEIVIPKEALLEDFGKYRVAVQISGEGYELRPVHIGVSNGAMVTITDGLEVGERVVIEGAYQVKMASMSGEAPAHGHTH